MCTLAWNASGGQLWVCFNRDEKRVRAEAEPPAVYTIGKHSAICPRDPEGGGTWFLASEGGFVLTLLNYYLSEGISTKGSRSRGLLLLDLADQDGLPEVEEKLSQQDLTCYAPFSLFILSRGQSAHFMWDGDKLTKHPECEKFWTTSSYRPGEVVGWRETQWRREGPVFDLQSAVDRMSVPFEKSAYGFKMDREDARTVSQIQLVLDEAKMSFTYLAREKNGLGFSSPVTLSMDLFR